MNTAIIYGFSFNIANKRPQGVSREEFKTKIATSVVDSPDYFRCTADKHFFEWKWKRSVRRTHLIPFLDRYYSDFYGRENKVFTESCAPVLDFLATNPSEEELIHWAGEVCLGPFYLMDDWCRIVRLDGQEITVNLSVISLSSEGKVMYEEMHQHLSFLEKLMRKVYSDNPFGKCLTIDIN